MSKLKVLITHISIPRPALDLLSEKFELVICPELPAPTREQILDRVCDVDAIFWWTREKLDRKILDMAGKRLKVISTMSAGYNHLDIEEIKARGIKVGNTPNVLNTAVAEIALGLTLATARRLQEGRHKIVTGEWGAFGRPWMMGQEVCGSTVGIVGLGGIGQTIAKRLKAFDVKHLLYTGHSPKAEGAELGAEFVSFEDLLRRSDYVILACPLTDETTNLMNEAAFSKMKKNAILINISRGQVVDQEALIKALQTKQIWGAGLDVMTPEPLPPDHALLKLPNCVLVPHLGTSTTKTRDAMAILAANNIIAAFEGKTMPAPL